MTEQLSQEQLDKETDAMIIQMDRAQRTNYLKFVAMMILLVISVFAIISMTIAIAGEAGARQAQVEIELARVEMFKNMKIDGVLPEKTILTIINGGKDVRTTLPAAPAGE